MPCSPRTADGRCHVQRIVYEKDGKRVELPIGEKTDFTISRAQIQSSFKTRTEKQGSFPEDVRVSMNPTSFKLIDISGGTQTTRLEFIIDAQGLKIEREYDSLSIWMALYIGLNHDEIHINRFYENLYNTGFYD